MKTLKYLSLSVLVLATLALIVPAQQTGIESSQHMSGSHCMDSMGMHSGQSSMAGSMMQDHNKMMMHSGQSSMAGPIMLYHDNMMSFRQSADNLRQNLANARQSNDPSQMRKALEEADRWIGSMNSHLNECEHVMGGGDNMGSKIPETQPQPDKP